jgi:eukaryotic-like serine/threonine-protein kinase
MNQLAPDLSWRIPPPGATIASRYVIEAECGGDDVTVMLSAEDSQLDRRVAIKMLSPEWAGDFDMVDQFLRAAHASMSLANEHTVHVFDSGTLPNGRPYLVAEYPDGRNFDQLVHAWGPLAAPTAIDWMLQAAEAVAEAHALGTIHGHLKLAHLFLTQRSNGSVCVKITDFGLSPIGGPLRHLAEDALAKPIHIMESLQYMAPEQLRSPYQAHVRTDIWALGAIVYELIAGESPFRAETLSELKFSVLSRPPTPLSALRPNVPPSVEAAIARCLQKDPDDRFGNVAAFAAAFAPYGTHLARASCDRIAHTLIANRSAASIVAPVGAEQDPSEAGPVDSRVPTFQKPASARIVVGSLLLLTALFAGVFAAVYADVHRSPALSSWIGVAEPQATAPGVLDFIAGSDVPAPSASIGATAPQPPSPAIARMGVMANETAANAATVATASVAASFYSTAPEILSGEAPSQASSQPSPAPTAKTFAPATSRSPAPAAGTFLPVARGLVSSVAAGSASASTPSADHANAAAATSGPGARATAVETPNPYDEP